MDTLLQDLRHGFRRLARSPAFAGLLVLSLGLGFGVNIALFRLLDAAVLMKLRPAATGVSLWDAAVGEGGGFFTTSAARSAPGWRTRPAGDRARCLDFAVMGVHTRVSFQMAPRSGEIGVRVGVGGAGREACA